MLRKRVFQGVNQGSASGTGSPGSRSPGLVNLGTHFKIRDWDRDSNSKFAESETWTENQISKIRDWDCDRDEKSEHEGFGIGTDTQNSKIPDRGLGPGLRFAGRGIPGLEFGGLSRGLKNSGTRSRRLKIFRETLPVPCRPLESMVERTLIII